MRIIRFTRTRRSRSLVDSGSTSHSGKQKHPIDDRVSQSVDEAPLRVALLDRIKTRFAWAP
jgi:hypothetical protein